MLGIVFSIIPAIYAGSEHTIMIGVLTFVMAFAANVIAGWLWSRTLEPIDMAFSTFRGPALMKARLLQVLVPSAVGWGAALYFFG